MNGMGLGMKQGASGRGGLERQSMRDEEQRERAMSQGAQATSVLGRSSLSTMAFVSFSTSGFAPGSGQCPQVTSSGNTLLAPGALPLSLCYRYLLTCLPVSLDGKVLENGGHVTFSYLTLVTVTGL